MPPSAIPSAQHLIDLIHASLTPDLLDKKLARGWSPSNPLYGHCYVATEALWWLLRYYYPDAPTEPRHGKDGHGVSHWWLVTAEGEVIDPTAEQYTSVGEAPPYDRLVPGGGFQSNKPYIEPSRRARILIERVAAHLGEAPALWTRTLPPVPKRLRKPRNR